jgi:ribonuclease P protein component
MRPTLRRAWQFELVYTQGHKLTSPLLVLFYLQHAPDSRVAYVASRKVGGAVQRNRAKRVLRAAFAEMLRASPGAVPGWIVLVARREILAHTSADVLAQMRSQLGVAPLVASSSHAPGTAGE